MGPKVRKERERELGRCLCFGAAFKLPVNYVKKASISRHFKTAVGVKLLLIICMCVSLCELLVFVFTQHPFLYRSLLLLCIHCVFLLQLSPLA